MSNQYCSKCGDIFYEGSLKYIVRIKVIADFDGYVNSNDEDASCDMDSLIGQIERSSPEALENDIHQEMVFLLCKDCRNAFARNPLNLSKGYETKKGNFPGLLH